MKKFFIQTLGCKVNQYESDGIAVGLEQKGWTRSKDKSDADIFIINTCAVTSKAGMQSRQAIRKIIRENPDSRVIVTGCHAQTDPEEINKIEHIDQVVCHKDKTEIAHQISAIYDKSSDLNFKPVDHTQTNKFKTFEHTVKGDMTRAYLKIQDGCESFCTYCIVPYARGSSVSMPENEVIRNLKDLNQSGFKEVIMTGIHTGMYGMDLNPPISLTQLLERINREKLVHQLRLSSIEPTEITDGLIDLAGLGKTLCNHFHIPLQSGDDEILKKMKRPYTSGQFETIVNKIVQRVPSVGIGVDVLVGFPTETDEQFDNTYQLLKRLPVSYLHVFPFSARKGTPAFHFKPKVPSETIKIRTKRLRDLDREKKKTFIQSQIDKPIEGLVQNQIDQETGMLKVITTNYLTIFAKHKQGLRGKTVEIIPKRCHKDLSISGDIIS